MSLIAHLVPLDAPAKARESTVIDVGYDSHFIRGVGGRQAQSAADPPIILTGIVENRVKGASEFRAVISAVFHPVRSRRNRDFIGFESTGIQSSTFSCVTEHTSPANVGECFDSMRAIRRLDEAR